MPLNGVQLLLLLMQAATVIKGGIANIPERTLRLIRPRFISLQIPSAPPFPLTSPTQNKSPQRRLLTLPSPRLPWSGVYRISLQREMAV